MSELVEDIAVGAVALLHVLFLLLEMILWDRPIGRKVFGLSKEFSRRSASLAANQGLYNGFLAAGLIWSFFIDAFAFELRVFFLVCIILAGLFAAVTVNRVVLWVQALPAALALALVMMV